MSEPPQEKTQAEENAPAAPPGVEASPELEASPEPASGEPTAEPVGAPARTSSLRGVVFAFLLVVVVAGLLGWYWYQGRVESSAMREELAQKLADADAKVLRDRRVAAQTRDTVSAVQGRLGKLESRLGKMEAELSALATSLQELSRDRNEGSIAEIEQILIVANQQLQLTGNVTAALKALGMAQEKLQRLAQPGLDELRGAISADRARLQKLGTVDTVGTSAQLDGLLARVDKLPLAMDVRPAAGVPVAAADTGQPVWKRLLRETWEGLKQLVRIQRVDRPEAPLLAPSQAFFLRENLKLRLLGARIALLARDGHTFKADLEAAQDWLKRYYDTRSDAVARGIEMLSSLRAIELGGETADLSASLEAMRKYRRARAQATAKP